MTAELLTLHSWPRLERPALAVCLEGWIDAGQAAATAVSALRSSVSTETVATFQSDLLIDHRARRPVLRIVNGVETALEWPELRLEVVTENLGRDLLVLSGPEPDMRWHQLIDELLATAGRLGVELVVGLGAFPAPVPHTRPVRLAASSTDAELAGKVGYIPATIDVPSGLQGALLHQAGVGGLKSVGLWARVPHYASALPYPAAAAVLLDELAVLAGLDLDTADLHRAGKATAAQIDELVSGSEEHVALVRQLERQHDAEEGLAATGFGELPSGDELAEELQRFLRGER